MHQTAKVILINRMLGYDGLNIALKGHSGKAYGKLSRYSPEHKCHIVELSLADYEAAREDIFKKTRHSMSGFLLWEPQIVLGDAVSAGADSPVRGSDGKESEGNVPHPIVTPAPRASLPHAGSASNTQHPMKEAATAAAGKRKKGGSRADSRQAIQEQPGSPISNVNAGGRS